MAKAKKAYKAKQSKMYKVDRAQTGKKKANKKQIRKKK